MSKISIQTAYKTLLKRNRLLENPGQKALVERLSQLQHSLATSDEPQKGLYIYGDVGTGKSRIADLFSATISPHISTRRVHFNEFMMDVHMRLHHARSQATYTGDPLVQIGREIREESRVLCFDEFQVTDIADAMILKRLFGAIWKNGGVMVSTSNRHPTKLYDNGLNRSLFLPFIEELQKRCEVWKMEGNQDYRLTVSIDPHERDSVFFTNPRKFEESLLSVVMEDLKVMSIPVMMSRELKVLAARTNNSGKLVVSETFKNLCEAFLGSSDYHALCKTSDIIYLSGLRQFKADELDYVRRFITLVDLAYESKTRVVCLSTVPLFEVFATIVPNQIPLEGELKEILGRQINVRKEGGSSSSMTSTFIGEMEWSATGLSKASLASGGAGETDVKFAIGRAVSRLFEMGSKSYGLRD
jgi:protein AFG1